MTKTSVVSGTRKSVQCAIVQSLKTVLVKELNKYFKGAVSPPPKKIVSRVWDAETNDEGLKCMQ